MNSKLYIKCQTSQTEEIHFKPFLWHFFKHLFLFYMQECFAGIDIHALLEYVVPWDAKVDLRAPGNGIKERYEFPCGSQERNPGPLQEQ